jgi:DNA-binding transcriptional regulator YiaG
MRKAIETGSPVCNSVPGSTIDPAIGKLLIDTVTPLSLEVALSVQAELETRADEADALRHSHVERCRHQAELARRRYMTVDPDNRLVADNLEAEWNDALRQLTEAQAEYERVSAAALVGLSEENKARIRALVSDFPRLWSDPNTPARERKRMARLLIEDVTIMKSDQIRLHVRFRGGTTTSLRVPIPLRAWQSHQTNPETLAALDGLLDTCTDAQAAEALNRDGHRSGTGREFTARIVLDLRRSNGLPSHLERLRARGLLTIPEVAERLGVSKSTIKAWHRAGLLVSHQANDKNVPLFEPPPPGDPRLVKCMGRRIDQRVLTQRSTGGAV